ncbi:UNVERIFIED_ORG: hypothetical protein ABIC54_001608 [Burkholderia sp. 1263]
MPKKPKFYRPTPEEDAEIQRGIDSDPDTFIPTDEEFAQMKRRGILPPTEQPGSTSQPFRRRAKE